MENPLPEANSFIGSDVTEGDFKVAQVELLNYLKESVGPNGENYIPYEDGGIPTDIQQDGQAVVSGEWVTKGFTLASSVSLSDADNTPIEYDVTNYLPDDGYVYLVTMRANTDSAKRLGAYCAVLMRTDLCSDQVFVANARCFNASYSGVGSGAISLPVGAGRKVILSRNADCAGATASVRLTGYRRLYKA